MERLRVAAGTRRTKILLLGAMGAGKTTLLVRCAKDLAAAKEQHLVLKPAEDNRSGEKELRTHDGEIVQAQPISSLADIEPQANHTYIIDEHHFFTPGDWHRFLPKCEAVGASIISAGLEYDFYTGYLWFPNVEVFVNHSFDILHLQGPACERCRHAQAVLNAPRASLQGRVGGFEAYEGFCKSCGFERAWTKKAGICAYADDVVFWANVSNNQQNGSSGNEPALASLIPATITQNGKRPRAEQTETEDHRPMKAHKAA